VVAKHPSTYDLLVATWLDALTVFAFSVALVAFLVRFHAAMTCSQLLWATRPQRWQQALENRSPSRWAMFRALDDVVAEDHGAELANPEFARWIRRYQMAGRTVFSGGLLGVGLVLIERIA
jgi:hypothetical protein